MNFFSESKFNSLTTKRQHKHAAEILKTYLIKKSNSISNYETICKWMNLPIPLSIQEFHDRYYDHMQKAQIPLPSHIDSFEPQTFDPPSQESYLPITIYLDNLRSAFNVGSILRTMEAFRIKNAFFAKNTPFIDHPKVQETSMGTHQLINAHRELRSIEEPIIALECTQHAQNIFEFEFPERFTLVLGNEALGVSKDILEKAQAIVKIPLLGAKNSLNVASAFAIAAYEIRRQLSSKIAS